MTDYPTALAAAREAHTYVKHRGMTRAEAALGDLLAALDAARGQAVAFLYTLEYGSSVADRRVSTHRLNYPFGVCGADYQRSNEDGVSYVRETPLYAAPPAALAVPDRNAIDDAIWRVLDRHNCNGSDGRLRVELIEAVFSVMAAPPAPLEAHR